MLKKSNDLTRSTPARRDAPFREQAAGNYHSIRGGWDDPHCARPTRAFGGRTLREHRDRPSHPTLFFSILLEKAVLLEIVLVDDGRRFGGKLSPFLQQSFDVFPDQIRFEIDLVTDLLQA